MRVPIVEDHVDCAQSMAMLLRLHGCEVTVTFDGPSGLEESARSGPDAVLLDIGLPGLDGFEVARRLRANASAKDLCIIAVTGYGRDEDRRQSEEAGIDLHLTKPINLDLLQSLLRRLLDIVPAAN